MKPLLTKIDKQYDGYLRYWSPSAGQIVNVYCGSLFVGHCTHSQLVDHFREFQDDLGLNADYLLHLGMDGPHVNKKFASTLAAELADDGKTFLNLPTSSCAHRFQVRDKRIVIRFRRILQ